MTPFTSIPMASQLDDLLETLWNLEDIQRDLVQNIQRLVSNLEEKRESSAKPEER